MRFAAGIFSYLVEREPILQKAAYVLILNIGIELILEDLAGVDINDWMKFGISAGTLVLAVAYARIPFLKIFRPILVWLSRGFSILNDLVSWLLLPLSALLRLAWRAIRRPARIES
jgi:tellurite resistance protein TerC